MQTFLPYADFARSAASLDRARLGKQRVETLQILRALVLPDYGWRSHPVVRMWMGYVPALVQYGLAMADEWIGRGGQDSTRANIVEFSPALAAGNDGAALPPWLGAPDVHRSHRSNLIRKDPTYYSALFPEDPPDLDYVWPEPEHLVLPAEPEGDRVWVLRMPLEEAPSPGTDGSLHFQPSGPNGRVSPKRQRQRLAFVSSLHIGDGVAVPLPGERRYATAVVAGPAAETPLGLLERPGTFTGIRERSSFGYPALLQDPRLLFAVEDLPADWP